MKEKSQFNRLHHYFKILFKRPCLTNEKAEENVYTSDKYEYVMSEDSTKGNGIRRELGLQCTPCALRPVLSGTGILGELTWPQKSGFMGLAMQPLYSVLTIEVQQQEVQAESAQEISL